MSGGCRSAWYAADQTLRMTTGQDSAQNFEFPYRWLFTREIAAKSDITSGGEASGKWYGDTGYQAGLLKLWGLAAR